ncbi:H+-ATPase subunit [Catenaria anguillulae PL171]|uniref:V-type proton ATPase subunit a n=1 Tax=Catenaria anguillulae PL171 TaxID=765915 RepID=A0A1Y2H9V5_9FUNG|nr:H+-ATPase subunit [Catenaria anguillulae PL171]
MASALLPTTTGTAGGNAAAAPDYSTTYFRSEPMSLIQLYIPSDIALATVSELGEVGLVQFRDLNPTVTAFQRTYVREIRRLDEMDRRLRYLVAQAEKANVTVNQFAAPGIAGGTTNYARRQQDIDELDLLLGESEARIVQMNNSQTTFNKKFLELTEMGHVLRETAGFFDDAEQHREEITGADEDSMPITADVEAGALGGGVTTHLGFVAGVIERRKLPAFERILWRALRGNLYLKSAEIHEVIVDPVTDESMHKNVFAIFAHGRETLDKIRRLSESLGATLYPVDANSEKRRADAAEVRQRLDDLNQVLFNTNATKRHELGKLADMVGAWRVMIAKEKAVYHTMNLFASDANGGGKTLVAEGWCPTEAIPQIQQALTVAKEATRGVIPSILNVLRTARVPPTYHKRNKLTSGFQEIIDAYGIARYREVNPALFSVITFPFLFAVMFGDFGHGILLLAFAVWMCAKEDSLRAKAKNSEMFGMVYGGRYMLLLMGIFSVFTGLIYNDAFSRMMSIFPSGWKYVEDKAAGQLVGQKVGTYPFGVDWAWQLAENKLLFTNSYKMKMSIVLGVIHMTFATFLSLANHLHYKKQINVWCMFVPQVLFMQAIFGYLVVCIVYKWAVNWNAPGAGSPPGLLNMLIFMFLQPGQVKPSEQLYSGQGTVQVALVLIALVCVPWMLCIKPYLLKKAHDRTVAQGYGVLAHNAHEEEQTPALAGGASTHPTLASDHTNTGSSAALVPNAGTIEAGHGAGAPADAHGGGGGGHGHDDGPFDFGSIVIDQVIHTIEYCLGCISNTASYLRLWALSLAHAQLSEVLWDMTLASVFKMTNPVLQPIFLVVIFPMFMGGTVFILLGMEGLSAFLHALRLHWVEFNNKFYEGSGHKFVPFAFKDVLED